MASDIWLRTILIVRKETRCCHIGYSFRLTARVLLYAPSHRQDSTYHGLCYTSRGALAGTRNSSMGPPHEGLIRRPTAPWANALPLSYIPLPTLNKDNLWASVRLPLWKRVKFYWMVFTHATGSRCRWNHGNRRPAHTPRSPCRTCRSAHSDTSEHTAGRTGSQGKLVARNKQRKICFI